MDMQNLKHLLLVAGLTSIATLGIAISSPATRVAKAQQRAEADWKPVEQARGKSGQVQAAGGSAPAGGAAAGGPELDPKQIEGALGRSGRMNNGVLQVSVPRAEKITENGIELLPAMGVNTALNFQPTGDGKAAITGDFVLVGREVNRVAKTLREHGIQVTALHNHALADDPRLFYMHFWANDDPVKLAQGLKAALELTNSKKAE